MTPFEKLNPYLSVWLQPRRTTRYVIENKSLLYTTIIISIGFIGLLLSLLVDSELYPTLPIWGIILLVIVLSPIFALLLNALYALELWLIGKLFKGIGTFKDIFKAMSLLYILYVFMIPFYVLWLLLEPTSLFFEYDDGKFFLPIIDIVLNTILSIWCFVISIPIVSEVHKISNWKSFFSLVLSGLLLILLLSPIFIIIVVIYAFL